MLDEIDKLSRGQNIGGEVFEYSLWHFISPDLNLLHACKPYVGGQQ